MKGKGKRQMCVEKHSKEKRKKNNRSRGKYGMRFAFIEMNESFVRRWKKKVTHAFII